MSSGIGSAPLNSYAVNGARSTADVGPGETLTVALNSWVSSNSVETVFIIPPAFFANCIRIDFVPPEELTVCVPARQSVQCCD